MAKRFLNVFEHKFDAIILGAGGSGLRCAYECATKWIKNRGSNLNYCHSPRHKAELMPLLEM